AIAGETLAEAQKHVEQNLGVALQPGGTHDVFATHNALLGLEDGLYLEAIATNPDAAQPQRPRWFDLDR
ncbi:VOC family protein, partial [Puniceicoccales bacterium CK1056]